MAPNYPRGISLAAALFVGMQFSVGQGFYNQGALVSLGSQTLMIIPDSLVNNGTLINNGELVISGTWSNQGTYEAGTGKINFNSDLPQTINHNNQSVGNLTVSGGGQKQFLADIIINGALALESGILVAGAGARIIINSGATVTGGSDQAHVNGPVERQGVGDWLFPMGNGITYLPVEITGVSNPSAVAILSLNELTSGAELTADAELADVSTRRYWSLDVTTGDLADSRIRLPSFGEEDLTDNADLLVVAASDVPAGPYVSLGKSAVNGTPASGFVTSDQSPTASFFAIAAVLSDRGIEVYNAVSVNADGKNDFMRIRNIELYPNNKVVVFNRWGDKVFEMAGYDNAGKNFRGVSTQNGSSLPAGTYYYSIDRGDGAQKITGYVVVK